MCVLLVDRTPVSYTHLDVYKRQELKRVFPKAIVGGTGSGSASRLEEIGVSGFEQDYSLRCV